MLELRLFGAGAAFYNDRPLLGFPHQQHHRLLCYLLLNRDHPHYRERLAAVFWDEYSTATSRTYLRNTLWRLRQALQEVEAPVDQYLSVDSASVSFLSSGQDWLDVSAFETAIHRLEDVPGHKLAAEEVDSLEAAVGLYSGDLLEGIYDDWCLYDRERLRLLYLNTLAKLLVSHEHNGTYERAMAHGERILACDPTREKVHRQMMRLYWLLGSPREALVQYKTCAQILREELGVAPTARTRLLYRLMVDNQFDPAAWHLYQDDRLPAQMRQDESIQSVARHALQKLHRLQLMTEETNTELQYIEQLLSQALSDAT